MRELRDRAGLTQQQLGDQLAVTRQTINAIETGKYTPSLGLAIELARLFNRTVEEIFHHDDRTDPDSDHDEPPTAEASLPA